MQGRQLHTHPARSGSSACFQRGARAKGRRGDLAAFEGPDAAADWRKKQADDNPEIGALTREIDKALGARAKSIEILCADYPLHDFAPVEAKVRVSRFFARVHVRTDEGQTAVEALSALLGPVAGELEIRSASGA